jgi:DNA primase
MVLPDAESYFESRFVIRRGSGEWRVMDCPFCGRKKKGAVHFDFRVYKCWVCGYKGSLNDVLMRLDGLRFSETVALVGAGASENRFLRRAARFSSSSRSAASFSLPNGYKNLLEPSRVHGTAPVDYVVSRGMDPQTASEMGFGYVDSGGGRDSYFGYLIIPFKRNFKIAYFIGRSYLGREPKYRNPPVAAGGGGKSSVLWNEDALWLFDKVFVCEGVFSAIAVGADAVAVMGKTVSQSQFEKMVRAPVSELVFCFDADASVFALREAARMSPFKKVKSLRLPYGDPADVGQDCVRALEARTEELVL